MSPWVRIERPTAGSTPLVFDSPHSGSIYPADFGHSIDRLVLRRSEDAHLEEIFAPAAQHGVTLVHALFPRAYIDPNRASDDIDVSMLSGPWDGPVNPTSKTLSRKVGLLWRAMRDAGPVYDRLISPAELRHRLDTCWQPYQDALAGALEAAHSDHGLVLHVNAHSMSSRGDRTTEDGPVRRPDVVVGDRDGTSCAQSMRDCVIDTFRGLGYSVALNDPYKGFEIVRRHGRPAEHRHSIQIELNRALYMEERTLAKTEGIFGLTAAADALASALAALAPTLSP
ncbi:MAG: N-formylglutamate amidohydrolase [Pseudomonadota bacterium]